jgi:hypothetical protein
LTVGVVGALVVLTVGVVVDVLDEDVFGPAGPPHVPFVSPCASWAGQAGIAIVIVTWFL